MPIQNLRNTANVNVANCDQEPIHLPGTVQDFGYLLGLRNDRIVYCSDNCRRLFNTEIALLLGQHAKTFLPPTEVAALNDYLKTPGTEAARPFVLNLKEQTFHVTTFVCNGVLMLELEPIEEDPFLLPDIYLHTKRFAYHTQRADNMENFCRDVAAETRKITGFDRVMIYRFDKDYNGEVFAESRRDDWEPMLGLHYPASDIPAQARALYLQNQVRLIADVNAEAVPLWGLAEEGQAAVNPDLSFSFLRSVSPMHIQYLKNMGVAASFSVSIVYKDRLWGLIACHHGAPKKLPYYKRLAAHLQGIFLASQIDVRLVADEFTLVQETEKKIDGLRSLLRKEEESLDALETLELLKDLVGADGFFVSDGNVSYKIGSLPGDDDLQALRDWLLQNASTPFHTDKLLAVYPAAKGLEQTIAGLLCVSPGKGAGHCAVWTRGEVERTVNWGGNPAKAFATDPESNTLSPRKSFAIWKEVVKNQSKPWRNAEINAASVICSDIFHHLHLKTLREEERRYRHLNERLQRANDELSNLNWISTHDLKEPLRKIQFYASMVLEKEGASLPESVRKIMERMQSSAAKMQTLVEDLLSYAKIVNEEKRFVNVDLNVVLEDVEAELHETVKEKGAKLQWQHLPVIKGIPFQLRQLFVNLVGNSLKFAKAGTPSQITIGSDEVVRSVGEGEDRRYHRVTVADNGIGFNSAYKEELFKIFQRLHGPAYAGSGIGLAICKKIAEAHNGFIEADGNEDGAVFTLYFPKMELSETQNSFPPAQAGAQTE